MTLQRLRTDTPQVLQEEGFPSAIPTEPNSQTAILKGRWLQKRKDVNLLSPFLREINRGYVLLKFSRERGNSRLQGIVRSRRGEKDIPGLLKEDARTTFLLFGEIPSERSP